MVELVDGCNSLRIMRLRLQIALALLSGCAAAVLVALYAKAPAPECVRPAHPCGGLSGFPCGGYVPCPGPHVRWTLVIVSGIAVVSLAAAGLAVRRSRR
jgi:hypothetical protein